MSALLRKLGVVSVLCALCACSTTATAPAATATTPTTPEDTHAVTIEKVPVEREAAPSGGTATEIHFPKIARVTTPSGLEVNTVTLTGLPIVHLRLVIRSGSAADPVDMPGTSQLVAQMLKEGTTKKNSAKIAETVDFLGAHLGIGSTREDVTIDMKALSDQLDEALGLVAELAMWPTFDDAELKKLKKRELDRLSLMSQSPSFLVRREFWKALYGETHPYAHVDTTKDVVKRIKKSDLAKWHRRNFVPNNAYLVVAGDVTSDKVMAAANRVFKAWTPAKILETTYPEPPARSGRQIVLVDRPESVQSVIYVGNVSITRQDPDFVPLTVANQVLGGSAASRMFMDLREKQSLTYGAYSDVNEDIARAPFRASAAVRNEVTEQAMKAFMHHLDRIVTEAAPEAELADAKRFLIDSFPLQIETSAEIAGLTSDLRKYGFADDYWDGFRSQIAAVTPDQALAAAKKHITPQNALIVVVGKASAIKDALSAYGPVKVIDVDGKVLVDAPAPAAAAPAAQPAAPAAQPSAAAPAAPAPAAPAATPAKEK